jgi:hypothetical protein
MRDEEAEHGLSLGVGTPSGFLSTCCDSAKDAFSGKVKGSKAILWDGYMCWNEL